MTGQSPHTAIHCRIAVWGHLFEDFVGAAGVLGSLAPVGVLVEGHRLGYRLTGGKTDYL